MSRISFSAVMIPRRRRRHRLPLDLYRCPDLIFSITVCTSPRADVFADEPLARLARDRLLQRASSSAIPLYAYCLMPDHVHVVLSPGAPQSVVSFVGAWKSEVFRLARERGRRDPFWQRSFWDRALRNERGVHSHCLYVLHNPVRAGLVEQWRDYPWCRSTVFRF